MLISYAGAVCNMFAKWAAATVAQPNSLFAQMFLINVGMLAVEQILLLSSRYYVRNVDLVLFSFPFTSVRRFRKK